MKNYSQLPPVFYYLFASGAGDTKLWGIFFTWQGESCRPVPIMVDLLDTTLTHIFRHEFEIYISEIYLLYSTAIKSNWSPLILFSFSSWALLANWQHMAHMHFYIAGRFSRCCCQLACLCCHFHLLASLAICMCIIIKLQNAIEKFVVEHQQQNWYL